MYTSEASTIKLPIRERKSGPDAGPREPLLSPEDLRTHLPAIPQMIASVRQDLHDNVRSTTSLRWPTDPATGAPKVVDGSDSEEVELLSLLAEEMHSDHRRMQGAVADADTTLKCVEKNMANSDKRKKRIVQEREECMREHGENWENNWAYRYRPAEMLEAEEEWTEKLKEFRAMIINHVRGTYME